MNGTEHVFLTDDKNKIVGTISFSITMSKEGLIDIYFYDEIVDYFTLLPPDSIESKRSALMESLFAAARLKISEIIPNLTAKIESNQVHAFIRAAADRVENYINLGCSKKNTDTYVIHGAPTPFLKMIDDYIKEWAKSNLKTFLPSIKTRDYFLTSNPSSSKQIIAEDKKETDISPSRAKWNATT